MFSHMQHANANTYWNRQSFSSPLTFSLKRLVARPLSLLSFLRFSSSGSLSAVTERETVDVPKMASSWAALICSSLLAYILTRHQLYYSYWINSPTKPKQRTHRRTGMHKHQMEYERSADTDEWCNTSMAENRKLWPIRLTTVASSSATANKETHQVSSILLCSFQEYMYFKQKVAKSTWIDKFKC